MISDNLGINEKGHLTFASRDTVELAEKYGVPWLYSDFKKREGYKRSIILSKEYDLYRQNYCGCVFSKRDSVEEEN